MVERARAKWEDAPKYLAHVRPAPQAHRRSQRGQGSATGRNHRAGGGSGTTADAEAVLRGGRGAGVRDTGGETGSGALPLHGHVCGPFCVLGLWSCGPPIQILKIWPSPRPSARSSSAMMCRVLGPARPFLQRLIVWGWTPRRRFSSAHGMPDASLNRSRRSGKSSGKV